MIATLASLYPVRLLCALWDVAPSSYYYQPVLGDDLAVLVQIEEILLTFPTYGYRRVTIELGRRGCVLNHKRVLRLMQQHDLIRIVRKRVQTTRSNHNLPRHTNFSRIVRRRGFIYLAIILDVYTRSVRGWCLDRSLGSELALTALRQALRTHRPEIHHSDQGVQYAAHGYVELLRSVGAQVSMGAIGRPTDNPYAERVIRTIKEEEVYLNEYEDLEDARQHIGHFLQDVYQTKRIHSALGYLTPAEFEASWHQQSLL